MLKRELHDVRRPLLHLGRPVGVQSFQLSSCFQNLESSSAHCSGFGESSSDGAMMEPRSRSEEGMSRAEREISVRRFRLLLSVGLGGLGGDGARRCCSRSSSWIWSDDSGVIDTSSVRVPQFTSDSILHPFGIVHLTTGFHFVPRTCFYKGPR
jgi:hypothetical protein